MVKKAKSNNMPTAKALGFIKGEYAVNSLGWLHKLISHVHTTTPFCEVWGIEHEFGSIYANELYKIKPGAGPLLVANWVKKNKKYK